MPTLCPRPRWLAAAAVVAAGVALSAPARADRPAIAASPSGRDLEVTVRHVTDYCASDADVQILVAAGTIRIVRGRPSRVSRCFTTRDKTFVIPNVAAGTYTITYEQVPLVAPARALVLASTTAAIAP